MLARLRDRVLGRVPSNDADPMLTAQYERALGTQVFCSGAFALALANHARFHAWTCVAIDAFACLAPWALGLWMRRAPDARRVALAETTLAGFVTVVLALLALWSGQTRSSVFWLLIVVPLMVTASQRAIAATAGGCLLAVCAVWASERVVHIPTELATMPQPMLLLRLGSIAVLALAAAASRRAVAGHVAALNARTATIQAQAAELRVARDAALALADAKSEFLANVSHELRTPLVGVLGMADALLDGRLEPEQREQATVLRDSGQVLLTLINDLLDLSRAEAGELRLERVAFEPRRCIDEALALVLPLARARGLALRAEVAPGTPERCTGDPNRVRQVLLNLLGNAVKFTPEGEVVVSVDLAARPEGAAEGAVTLRFRVRDTGVGISAETQAVLFKPFSQGDAAVARRFGGTGLGLAISRRLARAMGGDVWIESAPGQGATAYFTAVVTAAREAHVARAAPVVPAVCAGPLRILLADDNVVVQKVGLMLLRRLGYTADVAADGTQVVAAVEQADYDVLLLDVQMPEMDGLEATRRVRVRPLPASQPWIIALTAGAAPEDRRRCLAAGMNDFLLKPVSIEVLAAALIRARDARAAERDAPAVPAESRELADDDLDVARLADLKSACAQDPAQWNALLDQHVGEARRLLDRMASALARGDAVELGTAAHSLRGSSAMFGMVRVAGLCSEVEALATRAALAEAAEVTAVVRAASDRAHRGLRRYGDATTGDPLDHPKG